MSTRFENRSTYSELIDDLVDTPLTSTFNPTYSSLPGSLNKFDHQALKFRERKRDLNAIIKHLYEEKLLSSAHNQQTSTENSDFILTKSTKENRTSMENLDFISIDGDLTTLQRELKEKELDILHLRKEIQELQTENKLLKSKNPNINFESDTYRREREILQNELRSSQQLIVKLQQQNRCIQIDETILHEKEFLEKQMKLILNENEKFKQNFQQTERIINQLRKDNEELQMKLNEAKRKNDELFYQEFHSLRNDIKILKQKNNELFEENLRLQKSSKVERKTSQNQSEDRYDDKSYSYRSKSTDYQNNSHSIKTKRPIEKEVDISNDDDDDEELLDDSKPTSIHHHVYRSEFQQQSRRPRHQDQSDDQRTTETISPRRPYAPTTINDIHLNDVVKFSRPGGKISKGSVKYIGLLPDKNEQYLGLELEDEESKHDGVYQDRRYFQCKPNKGVFVAFSKVIMAWSLN